MTSANFRENPAYFEFFSRTDGAARVTPEEALQMLNQVAQDVYERTGVNPHADAATSSSSAAASSALRTGKKRKRRSFREFVSNSLGRSRKKKAKKGAAKERTASCGEEGADYEQKLASLVKSASLDPTREALADVRWPSEAPRNPSGKKANSLPPQTAALAGTAAAGARASHFYYNQDASSTEGEERQPGDPSRHASLPQQARSMSVSSAQGGRTTRKQQLLLQAGGDSPSRFPLAFPQHVLHKECRRALLRGEADEEEVLSTDLVLVHSGQCRVSRDWCSYIRRCFAGRRGVAKGEREGEEEEQQHQHQQECPRVWLQEVEAFSRLLCAGKAAELLRAEERTRHARAQVVVVGPDFLNWLRAWPTIITGKKKNQN